MTKVSPRALGTLDVLCLVGPMVVPDASVREELVGSGLATAVGSMLYPTNAGRRRVQDRLDEFLKRTSDD